MEEYWDLELDVRFVFGSAASQEIYLPMDSKPTVPYTGVLNGWLGSDAPESS